MKGKFDLAIRVQNRIVDQFTAHDFRVHGLFEDFYQQPIHISNLMFMLTERLIETVAQNLRLG